MLVRVLFLIIEILAPNQYDFDVKFEFVNKTQTQICKEQYRNHNNDFGMAITDYSLCVSE